MKEAFFIILVIVVLFGLTAVRYRREIVAFITFYKQLKAAGTTNLREGGGVNKQREVKGIQLVRCNRCGKFVPETETVYSAAKPVCSAGCAVTNAV